MLPVGLVHLGSSRVDFSTRQLFFSCRARGAYACAALGQHQSRQSPHGANLLSDVAAVAVVLAFERAASICRSSNNLTSTRYRPGQQRARLGWRTSRSRLDILNDDMAVLSFDSMSGGRIGEDS